ncbi:hypothetical protein [Roseibium aggregatum]|uniref:hypothetical protein n=1 Tax=Roseibium aggregatum TaxID=187304 RepID=UPI003A97D258
MFRTLISLLVFLAFVVPLQAEVAVPVGIFKVVNTEGFVQSNGERVALETDMSEGTALIERDAANRLNVEINGAQLNLFPLDRGLAALTWDANGTALLHDIDVRALFGKDDPEDVPAWGAELEWPGSGTVQFVLLPLGDRAYTAFLISHPSDKTVVRQMEFRQFYGPSDRPEISFSSSLTSAN